MRVTTLHRPPADPIPHPALDHPVDEATPERGLDKVVFGVTAAVSLAFLVWGFLSTDSLASASGSALSWVMRDMGWLFVTTSSAFVVFVIWLAAGRFGNIPLGRDDEEPEFRTVSWVAMIIARISRGRTVRQFVTGVLLVPSLVSLVWFCIFGGAAIDLQRSGTDIAGAGGIESQLFTTLESFPLSTVASVVVMLLVAIFFVSGADAASIVMGTLSERGTQEPSRRTVIFWGVATGAAAAVLLLVGGTDALTGLQTITIVAALPFVVVMIGLAVSLVKDLRSDPMTVRRRYAVEAVEAAVIAGVTEHGDDFVIAVDRDPTT